MITAEVVPTEQLILRPLRPDHAREMAGVLCDPALYAFTGGEPPSVRTLRSRYERWEAGSGDPAESWCNWVVASRQEGCLTGTVQATVTREDDGSLTAEIAWVVGTPWQGRGIATEAARALVTWLRRRVARIVAHVHPGHGASAAVAAATGLTPTEHLHDGEIRWQHTIRPLGLDELRGRALRVHDLYDELNLRRHGRTWTSEEFMLGFTGDVGDLAKLVMAEEGAREVPGGRPALEHELADCLWSVLILAHRYGIDLEAAFLRTTDGLDAAISARLRAMKATGAENAAGDAGD